MIYQVLQFFKYQKTYFAGKGTVGSHECELSGKGAGIKVLAVWPNSNPENFDKK